MESVAYGFWLHRLTGSALEANRFGREYGVIYQPLAVHTPDRHEHSDHPTPRAGTRPLTANDTGLPALEGSRRRSWSPGATEGPRVRTEHPSFALGRVPPDLQGNEAAFSSSGSPTRAVMTRAASRRAHTY
jgi:hypothetical protein